MKTLSVIVIAVPDVFCDPVNGVISMTDRKIVSIAGTMLAELGPKQVKQLIKFIDAYKLNFPAADTPLYIGVNEDANIVSLNAELHGIKLTTTLELQD